MISLSGIAREITVHASEIGVFPLVAGIPVPIIRILDAHLIRAEM